MLTPDWLDYQLDRLKISRDLEEGIIRDIARRITKTGYATETADWQAERARQAGILREDVIRRVAASSKKSEREIRQLFKEAKLLIFDGSDTPTRGMNHIWNAALRKTCTTADNLTKTIAITSQKTYIEAADLAHMEIMSGAFTYDQAITNAIKKAAKDGAKVKYPSGAVTSVEAAVRRAVLTGVNQTSGKLCEMRCDELRCDLVEVSAHYGARPSHAEWQGGVYSRSGRHPEYESLVDATGYGTGEGLMGWNCNHSMAPFFEGMSKRNYTEEQLRDMREHTVTYNGKTMTDYEASQLQRGMERKIRHSRNKLTALDEQGKVSPSDKQKNAFAAESVRLKAREGKLRDFCKQTGRRSDSLRTRTASWNRSTSQKAVWANKKAVDNVGGNGIIKLAETVEEVKNVQHIGEINISVLEGEFGAIPTKSVVLTKEREKHIKEGHPDDYILFEKHSKRILEAPNCILKDSKNANTVFVIKHVEETNMNIVVKLAVVGDDAHPQNSIMTAYRIRDKNVEKLKKKHKTLYKSE